MPKYTGTVNMLMNDTVDIDAEVKRLKQSAKAAGKMQNLFVQQSAIMGEQCIVNSDQIRLLKEQKKVIAKLGKIK